MIPKEVLNCENRPSSTKVIKLKKGFAVCEAISKYNPDRQKSGSNCGNVIGHIELISGKWTYISKAEFKVSDYEYGGSNFLNHHCAYIHSHLMEIFGSKLGTFIYSFAMMKLLYPGLKTEQFEKRFRRSCLSSVLPLSELEDETIKKNLEEIGILEEERNKFMLKDIIINSELVIDGTPTTSKNKIEGLSKYEHPDKIDDPIINALFVYDMKSNQPVYFKCYKGYLADVAAMKTLILDLNKNNITVTADKGFLSSENIKLFDEQNIDYIIPIKKNSKQVRKQFNYKYDGMFSFDNTTVNYFKAKIDEKHFLYCFRNSHKAELKENEYILKTKQKKEGYSMEDFPKFKDKFGVICFISLLDKEPKEIYDKYSVKWEIEHSNENCKTSARLDIQYVHEYENNVGMFFINFTAQQMFYKISNFVSNDSELQKYDPMDLIQDAKDIRKITNGNKHSLTDLSLTETLLFTKLGIELNVKKENEERGRGRPRKIIS